MCIRDRDYSIWNLGLGFGRAYDAARDGAWLYRARKMDSVVVCFGVNDILRGRSAQQLCGDLETIVSLLQQSGCRVVLFTTPPFDLFTPEQQKVWREVNQFVRAADFPDAVFDIASVLGLSLIHIFVGFGHIFGIWQLDELSAYPAQEFV